MNYQIREKTCQIEHEILSPLAAFSDKSIGRQRKEAECNIRTPFQRDRDRIIHSNSFRRLKHKTQVFLSPEGDHYRTRLTHTLEVAQIARTIARCLRLNEDLTEAIALGHDLGHTPFGHAGERALNGVCENGFKHYRQSLRVVDFLENSGNGLNLTFEVRNGIERHTIGEKAKTLEGRIVRLADKIAYINHDIDDARHAGVLNEEDIPLHLREVLGHSKSDRINTLVISAVTNSGDDIRLDSEIQDVFDELNCFMFERVYTNPVCKSEEGKAAEMIKWLFDYFCNHPEKLPEDYLKIYQEQGNQRAACDYIAGMTDRYAVKCFTGLFVPKSWHGATDYL
ncbi:MAG TPA: deoxyguanosinetriphosphate triphosphohydrolase [Clostridia bacterium]|nr:deoxyguanosinetriphosphate triphosphohydrolase [Clostridia bacterium]